MADILSYEGDLRTEASGLLRRELERLYRVLGSNPKKPIREEVRRILEPLAKDELSLEEAEELYEIVSSLVKWGAKLRTGSFCGTPAMWIGINWRRMKEERGREKSRG